MKKINLLNNARHHQFTALVILLNGWMMISALGCDTGNEDDLENGGDGDTDSDTDSDTDGDADSETDTGEEEPYTTALVITTDYTNGAYSTISMNDHKVKIDINAIHSDAVCRFDPLTDTPFIINRLGSDAIDVLDPKTFDIDDEYSVEASSNPHDIAVVSENRAYISRYGLAEMLIVKPFSGDEVGTVDLSDYADDDGIPEVSGLALLNDKLYAPVQRLDETNGWEAVGGGAIVVIDAASGDIEGDVELTGPSSYGAPEYNKALGQFVIAEPGSWSELDGGIELFDPETEEVSGFIITEEELNGNVTKGLILSETKGYAIVGVAGDNGSDTHLIAFNPKTGKVTKTLIETAGWTINDIVLTLDGGELWVTDRTTENAGVRIFDTKTDEEITEDPISVGLPPSVICFTR
jgi:streptogramin lyase